jgi:4-hydroxy-3-polyprenylbenzoate decarboxylase
MAWRTLRRYLRSLDKDGEVLRITRPVRVELEAGCIADLLVKTGGPAVIFEKPELSDGSISEIPLVMNLFGTKERTLRALQAETDTEIGDRLVSLMKPDIGTFVSKPWKGIPLARDALALPPKKVRRAKCQEVVMEGVDLTRLPIPKTWPMDGGHYVTLPLVVTKNPETEEHNLGM